MGFNRTGQKRACPVCRGDRRDCRETTDTPALYFCRTDNPSLDFEFKKFDVHGFGVYLEKAILDAQDKEQREEWKRQRQAETEARLKAEKERHARSLSEVERDIEIRKLLNQLPLLPHHRQDLKRRELTDEQIDQGMFRSVEQWQKLTEPVSHRLAGVNINGRSLNTQAGYICPIWNENDFIIGWQLRADNADDGGKYRWPTSNTKKRPDGLTVHLQNGELPLTVHIAKGDKNLRLAEGILKPYVAHCRRGQSYIGAAGGNFASSPQQLKQYIDYVRPEKIILTPDAGARANKNVLRQYRETANFLKSWGLPLCVEDWSQGDSKDGNCDVDEIRTEIKTTIIPFGEWDVESQTTPQGEQWQQPNTPEAEKQKQEWLSKKLEEITAKQATYSTLTTKPTITINSFKDFWGNNRLIPNSIIINDAFKSAGKTSGLLKAQIQILASQGKKILLTFPRRTLAMSAATTLGGYFQDDITISEHGLRGKNIITCCWDSLHKFAFLYWDCIVLDEGRAGLKHLAEAKTEIAKIRPQTFSIFEKMTRKALSSGGNVFLLDADLTDTEIEYVQSFGDEKTKTIYINLDAKPQSRQAEIAVGKIDYKKALYELIYTKASLLNKQVSEAINLIEAHNPSLAKSSIEFKQKVWEQLEKLRDDLKTFCLTSDCQSDIEAIFREISDRFPEMENYAIRIDKKTSEEEWAKEFIRDINPGIENNCILIWGWSPSLMVGVSQTTPRFKEGFFIYTGILEPCEFRQQMLRSRTCEYWYGWIANHGAFTSDDFDSWDADKIKTAFLDRFNKTLADKNLDKFYRELCQHEISQKLEDLEDTSERLHKYFELIADQASATKYLLNPHVNLLAKIKARSEYNRYHCGEIFLKELQDKENFILNPPSFITEEIDESDYLATKERKEEIKLEDAELMQLGAEMSEEEMVAIADSKLDKDVTKIAGYKVAKSHPGLNTSINFYLNYIISDRHWKDAQFLYFLAKNPSVSRHIEAEELVRHTLKWINAELSYLPDIRHQFLPNKLLKNIGLFKNNKLSILDTPYDKNSVAHIHKKAKKYHKQFQQNFGVKVGKNAITFIHSLLDRLGVIHALCGNNNGHRKYEVLTLEKYLKKPTESQSPELLNKLIYQEAIQQSLLQKYWDKMATEQLPIYGEFSEYTTNQECTTESQRTLSPVDYSNINPLSVRGLDHTQQASEPISEFKKIEEKIDQENYQVSVENTTDELIPEPFRSELKAFDVDQKIKYLSLTGEVVGRYLGKIRGTDDILLEFPDGREKVDPRYCLAIVEPKVEIAPHPVPFKPVEIPIEPTIELPIEPPKQLPIEPPIKTSELPKQPAKRASELKIKDCVDALVDGVKKMCDIISIDFQNRVCEVMAGFPHKKVTISFDAISKLWDFSGGKITSVPVVP